MSKALTKLKRQLVACVEAAETRGEAIACVRSKPARRKGKGKHKGQKKGHKKKGHKKKGKR